MTQYPLISIIIPSYKVSFFEETFLSACNQDYPNIEIIITDDNRSDDIKNIVNKHQNSFRFPILYFKNESQLYGEKNFIRGVYESHGEYIKFLCDDDVLYSNCVSRLYTAIKSDTDIVLASSRRQRIDEKNNSLHESMLAFIYPFSEDVKIPGSELINFLTDFTFNFIGEPTCILCKRYMLLELAENMFRLNGNFHLHLGDLFLYANLLRNGSLAFLAEPLSAFRISTGQVSQDGREQENLASQAIDIFRQSIHELGWYNGDNISNQTLTISSLNNKNDVQRVNLIELFNIAEKRNAKTNALESWLFQRNVPTKHAEELSSYLKEKKVTISLFLIDHDKNSKELEKTLLSYQKAKLLFDSNIEFYHVTDCKHSMEDTKFPFINHVINECIVNGINEIISSNQSDWLLILKPGDEFTPQSLFTILLVLLQSDAYDCIYGDDIYKDSAGYLESAFKPDFNFDFFLSLPAIMSKHWLFNCKKVLELGGFSPSYNNSFEFDYIIKLIEKNGFNRIAHISEPFFYMCKPILDNNEEEIDIIRMYLARRGYQNANVITDLPGRYRIFYSHEETPLVSIIIPTKDQLSILQRCITSLLEHTKYFNYELIIVDNNSENQETLLWLAGISEIDPERIKVLRYPHPFNYSAMNNMAARIARGEYLVLLNNDTAIVQNDWLDNLLNHALRPEVGIVGAKLLYPNSNVQHAGVVLGLRGAAEHIFINSEMDAEGYLYRLQVDQNYMVVTAACLLVRKSIYFEVGGLDENKFKVSYNDVDLCLKIRELGYLTVWTPHTIVMHEGSVSQKQIDVDAFPEQEKKFLAEQDALYNKWLPLIGRDPSYNINLSLQDDANIATDTSELTWLPMQLPLFIGHSGVHDFHERSRLITPFDLMKKNNLINGAVMNRFLSIAEIVKHNPDSLIFNQKLYFSDEFYSWCARIKRIVNPYMVYDLHEYPESIMGRQYLEKMRQILCLMDRVIVSSNELANILFDKKIHSNIIISPTKLDRINLSYYERNINEKPRIGWVADVQPSYSNELDFFYDAVKQFSQQVDWIVVGNCPEKFKPFIKEIHDIPNSASYIKEIISLNLDIAVIPHSYRLNSCEYSSSRILEHGACGTPIICSHAFDLYDNLPITVVPNSSKSWNEAINMHLHDLNASKKQGIELRDMIDKYWTLDKNALNDWVKNWLPD